MEKKLTRSRTDKMIGGVCAGLADYLNMDATLVRVLYVLVSIMSSAFPGLLVYIILLLVVPEE